MTGIFRFLKLSLTIPGAKKALVISQLLMVAYAFFLLAVPWLIRILIDEGIQEGDADVILGTSAIMAAFAVAGAVVAVAGAYYSARMGARFAHEIRVALYERIGRLSFGNLDRFNTSDLIVRLTSDTNIFKQTIIYASFYLIRGPVIIVAAIFAVFVTSPGLVWVMIATLLVTVIVMFVYARYAGPMFTDVQLRLDTVNQVLQENLSGVRTVKAFVREEHETERYDAGNDTLRLTARRPLRLLAVLQPSIFVVYFLGMTAALAVGGYLAIERGTVSVGEITVFGAYLATAMIQLVNVAWLLPELAKAEASINRIFEVYDTEAEVGEAPDSRPLPEIRGRVAFENVTFGYRDADGQTGEPVLRNINLVAEPGEMVAILGATGSGKTTLINLIPRSYDVGEGRVTIDGVDVREVQIDELRSHIGYALQQAILFSGSVIDNIRMGRPETTYDEAEAIARVADAHGFVSRLHDTYDDRVAREGANFSGGQRQRLSIARALAPRPKILILDDSTSAVDVATETRIQAGLLDVAKDTTMFIVAQRISTVLVADKIVVLRDGEIAAEGSHVELIESSDLYREIYESQLGTLDEARDLFAMAAERPSEERPEGVS